MKFRFTIGGKREYKPVSDMDPGIYKAGLIHTFKMIPSDLSPAVLLSHSALLNISYFYMNNIYVIRDYYQREEYFYPPVFTGEYPLSVFEKIYKAGSVITAVPEEMLPLFKKVYGDSCEISEIPYLDDYIVDNSALYDCVGGEYKSLRQAKNRFFNDNAACIKDIKDISPGKIHEFNDKILSEMIKKAPDNAGLKHEKIIFETLLEMIHNGGKSLDGIAIMVDRDIAGFTINDIIGSYSVAVYAKMDHAYKDIGPALASSDAGHQLDHGIRYCNLMADEGEENLKKSKMLLRPCHILKKYEIRIK